MAPLGLLEYHLTSFLAWAHHTGYHGSNHCKIVEAFPVIKIFSLVSMLNLSFWISNEWKCTYPEILHFLIISRHFWTCPNVARILAPKFQFFGAKFEHFWPKKPKFILNNAKSQLFVHSGTKVDFGLLFLSHCAQNRNFLTILVDTVGQKLVLDCLFCPTVQKIETFWQY